METSSKFSKIFRKFSKYLVNLVSFMKSIGKFWKNFTKIAKKMGIISDKLKKRSKKNFKSEYLGVVRVTFFEKLRTIFEQMVDRQRKLLGLF